VNQAISCGRAGGQPGCHDEANGRFSQHCESAQKPW